MILDKIENLGLYPDLGPDLNQGFEFIRDKSVYDLADGRYPLASQENYAMIQTYTTEKASRRQFEAHRKYVDIQFVFKGDETLFWMPSDRAPQKATYSEEDDALLFDAKGGAPLPLSAGYFVVLFPQDAHKPGCIGDQKTAVRKIVVKIKV